MVRQILINEKYIGNNVYNRVSFKLKRKRVRNPPDMWVRADGAFASVVDPEAFFTARGIIHERNRRFSDEEMLACLRTRFLNHAFMALGPPKSGLDETGQLADLIGTVDELHDWMRLLVKKCDLDEHFVVSGLIHSAIEEQRCAGSPEGRSETVDFWIKRVALLRQLLGLPAEERAKLVTDQRLQFLLNHAEEEVRLVDDYADICQSVCEQIQAQAAEIFDDSYWRERHAEIIRIMVGQANDDGYCSSPDVGPQLGV